jgi:predicted  nucleic acid-binding Zn-ribbon protein
MDSALSLLLALQEADALIDELDGALAGLAAQEAALDAAVARAESVADAARRSAGGEPYVARVGQAEAGVAIVRVEQIPVRARIAAESERLERDRSEARERRDASARALADGAPELRRRYERLRASRALPPVSPIVGGVCGACRTRIPRGRLGGPSGRLLADGCEACGALLYRTE